MAAAEAGMLAEPSPEPGSPCWAAPYLDWPAMWPPGEEVPAPQ